MCTKFIYLSALAYSMRIPQSVSYINERLDATERA